MPIGSESRQETCAPVLLDVQDIYQPEGYYEEEAQANYGDYWIKQWSAYQTAAHAQPLEKVGQDQATDSCYQQGEPEAQANSHCQQPGMEKQPCQQPYYNCGHYTTEGTQAKFTEYSFPEVKPMCRT